MRRAVTHWVVSLEAAPLRQQPSSSFSSGLVSTLRWAGAETTDGTGGLSVTKTACGCASWLTSAGASVTFAGVDEGEQRGQVLDVMPEARRESRRLAAAQIAALWPGTFRPRNR
jgi:hypothetical protein